MNLRTTALAVLLSCLPATRALERTELLPAGDTYLRITQAQQLWDAFDRAYGDRFRSDQQVQDFVAAFGEKLRKKGQDGKIPLELQQLFEMHKILRGEIASVYTDSKKGRTVESIYLAARATQEEFNTVLERLTWLQSQSKDEVVRKRESFQGTALITDIMRGGSTNEMSYWMGCMNGTMLLGSEREWVERNMVRLRNETITEPSQSKLSMRYPIREWTRNALQKKKGDERASLKAIWGALGLLDIKQYLLEVEVKDDTLVVDGTLAIANMQQGLFNLLDTKPTDYANDRAVPADATSVSYGRIDLAGFWQKLPDILSGLPPRQSTSVMGLITFFEQQSGLQIGPDLLDHAGSRFSLHTERVSTNQLLLLSLELVDGKAVEESLNKLLASPIAQSWASQVDVSDFRGHSFFQLKKEKPDADPPSLCAMGNHLLVGTKGNIVRRAVLQLESDAQLEPSTLQWTARKLAPENAFGYGGMDHRRAQSLIYINVSDTTFNAGIGFETAPGELKKEDLGENEISLNHLTSYLNNTYHYIEAVPKGLHHRLIIETEENPGAP